MDAPKVTPLPGLDLDRGVSGLFIKLPSTEIVDIVAGSAFDFIVVDLEHSQLSEGEALRLVRHAYVLGFPALARIPEFDRGAVNRLLEAGAAGIQLSTVRRAAQVSELRSASRYSPAGNRSISLSHPLANYGATDLAEYVAEQERRPSLVIAQIETATTEDPLDRIMEASPDVAFIGTADLAVDLEFDKVRVRSRIEEIAIAAEQAGVKLGAFNLDDRRVRYQITSSDLAVLRSAWKASP
jgi:4-hydroxy-2-oxoheptanedioate aldolase